MGERDFLTPPSCLNRLGVIIPTRDWLFSTLFVIQLCFTFGKKTAIWNCELFFLIGWKSSAFLNKVGSQGIILKLYYA
jgi:hypothetical protein